jgi:hypothetical protein
MLHHQFGVTSDLTDGGKAADKVNIASHIHDYGGIQK